MSNNSNMKKSIKIIIIVSIEKWHELVSLHQYYAITTTTTITKLLLLLNFFKVSYFVFLHIIYIGQYSSIVCCMGKSALLLMKIIIKINLKMFNCLLWWLMEWWMCAFFSIWLWCVGNYDELYFKYACNYYEIFWNLYP